MQKTYTYVVVFDYSSKHIFIKFPDLDEAVSQAESTDEALRFAKEVLQLTIESRLEDQEEIPSPTPLEAVELTEHQRRAVIYSKGKNKVRP